MRSTEAGCGPDSRGFSRAWRCLISAAIALGCWAALSPTASAGVAPQRLSVSSSEVSGSLLLRVTSVSNVTALSVTGRLRVRGRSARLVFVRCVDGCPESAATAHASRLLQPGTTVLAERYRVLGARRVQVRVRVGRRTVASRVLSIPRVVARPAPPSSAAPQLQTSEAASAAPVAPRLSTSPGLAPEWSPAISDYTVRCDPERPVDVMLELPDGTTATVNGVWVAGSRSHVAVGLDVGERITVALASGDERRTVGVRCVPPDLPAWDVERDGEPMVRYMTFTPSVGGGTPYTVIVDDHGVPVWWVRSPAGSPMDGKVIGNDVLWAEFAGVGGYSETHYDRVGLDGTARPAITADGLERLDVHDLIPDGAGGWYGIVYSPRDHVDLSDLGGDPDALVLDGEIVHLSSALAVDWRWRTSDWIGAPETLAWGDLASTMTTYHGAPAYDLAHLNSLELDGDAIVFSARHLDAVYRIRLSDGAIDWKLGGTPRAESLSIVGDPFAGVPFGGQHDARLQPDGTLTVLDNGTGQSRPPRAVRYRIERATRTAVLLEDLRDARVQASPCCGSARRLAGGHWLVSWGGKGLITELAPDAKPVLTLRLPGAVFSYRAAPWEGPPGGIGELRRAMDQVAARGLAG